MDSLFTSVCRLVHYCLSKHGNYYNYHTDVVEHQPAYVVSSTRVHVCNIVSLCLINNS
jgi:hypothetical protein